MQDDSAIALAGEHVLFTRVRGRVLEVRRVRSAEVAFRYEAPEGAVPAARLAASAERVGLIVTTEDDTSSTASVQEFIDRQPVGPPFEPSLDGYFPGWQQIEGGRVITEEFRWDLGGVRWIVRDPGTEPVTAALPREAIVAVFAGELAAYAVPFAGEDLDAPQRLIVREWRTGAIRLDRRIRGGVEALDLHADGRVVLNEDGGGLLAVAPDGAVRRLTSSGVLPGWAGDRVVYVRQGEREGDERLMVVEPDGRTRGLGVPAAEVKSVVTDGTRVLWKAHGCLLVTEAGAPAAREPGPGPCPRSEVFLDDDRPERLTRTGRVPLRLRCIAAAPAGCRGTVRVRLDEGRGASARVRFRIPVGRTRRFAPRLSRRAHRAALREARSGVGGVALEVEAIAVDPAGRSSVLRDGYSVEAPRR